MSDVMLLTLLYGLGILALAAEIFIPSHGVLSFVGLGFLLVAILRTFDVAGWTAGVVAVFACLVIVPTVSFLTIKYWRRTPIGKAIAPPNPIITDADTSVPIEQLRAMVGKPGTTVSPLRPVGICDFNGRRVSCVAQFGMIEAGEAVEGVGVSGSDLAVAKKKGLA